MSVVCGQCSRVNPSEAAYCYYDGAALAGRAGGPINAGTAAFPSPFVFPNGLSCRNFDQLASACQQNWTAAMDLLRQGYLGSFFGGMGRLDLLTAAQEAAKFPDMERGLDLLLAKLPTQAIQPPKLQAEPSEVNLGQLKVGDERASELHLTNLGMRLLYGTVTSDCKWLTLGDTPGHPEKLFQFGAEAIVPVQVRGQHLRAGTKPLEGRLIVDSNGGTITVLFKADVPITPYDGGLFAGAVTPRQVAEKAKANPKDAAPYFENGAIAQWYAANGWAYPVVGPTMPGMGGIQQFFEALGVAKAPKVAFSQTTLELEGAVGKTIETKIDVTTLEKKVVYGWATCDQPWVEVGATKLHGKIATIPITFKIPKPCPPLLEATIHVMGNGNQKADVPLKIKVAGGKAGVKLAHEEVYESLEIVEDEAPLSVELIEEESPLPVMTIPDKPPLPISLVEEPVAMQLSHEPAPVAAFAPSSSPVAPAAPMNDEESPFSLDGSDPVPTAVMAGAPPAATSPKPAPGMPVVLRLAIHLVPIAALFLCLLIPCIKDIFFPTKGSAVSGGGGADEVIDPHPRVKLVFDEGKLGADYGDTMNFAVHKIDPNNKNAQDVKLNWYPNGAGNSIVAKIDSKDAVFGHVPEAGKWMPGYEKGGKPVGTPERGKSRTFEFTKGIHITQTVTIEASEPIEVAPGEYKRVQSMCLARYRIHNSDQRPHRVGLRVLMDTCIGDNDGVPFLLPGVAELVDTSKDFRGPEVPDFVQVLEKSDLKDPGTILQLTLRVGEVGKQKLEPPERFLLTLYPGKADNKFNRWDVPVKSFKEEKDSCVVMYWNEQELRPNGSREVGFTYGLGNLSAEAGKLAVTVGGSFRVGGELTIVALIADRSKTATLDLPKGLELIGKETATQKVSPSRSANPSPVTWRVRAVSEDKQLITVSTDTGLKQSRRIRITDKSLFN